MHVFGTASQSIAAQVAENKPAVQAGLLLLMNKSNKDSPTIFAAVRCGTFEDSKDLSSQIENFSLSQLIDDLDCGYSSQDAGWVAASQSLSELSDKVRDIMESDDEEDSFDLVKININIDLEIIRKGK
jgi:hypothetical protein